MFVKIEKFDLKCKQCIELTTQQSKQEARRAWQRKNHKMDKTRKYDLKTKQCTELTFQ